MKFSVKNKIKEGVSPKTITSKKNKYKEVFVKNKKKTFVSSVTHSAKRQGKILLRKMLLSKVFHTAFKIFVGVLVSGILLYAFYAYFNTSISNDVVVSKSEIVDRVSKLTAVPKGDPDAVVRVEDADALKKQNTFYENVKSGDYIVMYPKVAIIYDLRNNSIVSIKKSEER